MLRVKNDFMHRVMRAALLLFAHVLLSIAPIPSQASLTIRYPYSLMRTIEAGLSSFGAPPISTRSSVGRLVASSIDPVFCLPADCTEVAGSIVLVERGVCSFSLKALRAQECGAIGIVISNTPLSPEDTETSVFPLADDGGGFRVRIPAVMVSHVNGQMLLRAIRKYSATVVVEIGTNIETVSLD